MAYNKFQRNVPPLQTSIKSVRPTLTKDRSNRGGHFVRAPSIESSKEITFNKLRNRTIAKVNIGCL